MREHALCWSTRAGTLAPRPIRRRALANPGIPQPHRGALADVYMLATLVHNADVFRGHTRAEAAAFHRAAMWAYRVATDAYAGAPADWPSDELVLARAGHAGTHRRTPARAGTRLCMRSHLHAPTPSPCTGTPIQTC